MQNRDRSRGRGKGRGGAAIGAREVKRQGR